MATSNDLYRPTENLSNDGAKLTLDELEALCAYWRSQGENTPTRLRALSDGRVVDADWNPASGDPIVYARAVQQ